MKILVTGCKGQLGSEIQKEAGSWKLEAGKSNIQHPTSNFDFIFTDIDELDITDYLALEKFIEQFRVQSSEFRVKNSKLKTQNPRPIDVIINCAAYTAVDKAENEEEPAGKINVTAVSNLAKICSKEGIFLFHISTDYVFDGDNYKPYTETDTTHPLSAYGRTKLDGEKEIILGMASLTRAIIIRTSWLYSSFGNNFVKSIIKYANERGKLNVVYDQVGSPTYARDLAKAILDIIEYRVSGIGYRVSGRDVECNVSTVEIYNYSNEGVCSWYDFAKAITELKDISCIINPIETKDYPTPAKRPHYSVLSKDKIKNDFKINIPYWRESLKDCLKLI